MTRLDLRWGCLLATLSVLGGCGADRTDTVDAADTSDTTGTADPPDTTGTTDTTDTSDTSAPDTTDASDTSAPDTTDTSDASAPDTTDTSDTSDADVEPPTCAAGTWRGTEVSGAPYVLRMPELGAWNGTLLVYALPWDDTEAPDAADRPLPEAFLGGTATEDALLAKGYALAASSFSKTRFAVDEGLVESAALVTRFPAESGCVPERTLLAGFGHAGSLVAMRAAEQPSAPYDGVLVGCGMAMGGIRWLDAVLEELKHLRATGLWSTIYGSSLYPDGDPDGAASWANGDLQDVFGAGEFVRLMAGHDHFQLDWYGPNGWGYQSTWWATRGVPAMGQVLWPGDPVNVGPTDLSEAGLTASEQTYLSSNGIPWQTYLLIDQHALGWGSFCGVVPGLPDAPNPEAVYPYAVPTGDLQRPVVTLHHVDDPLLFTDGQGLYRDRVASQERSARLLQLYVGGTGHCDFSSDQLGATVDALDAWVRSASRPAPSQLDDLPGRVDDFEPNPWRYPVIEQGWRAAPYACPTCEHTRVCGDVYHVVVDPAAAAPALSGFVANDVYLEAASPETLAWRAWSTTFQAVGKRTCTFDDYVWRMDGSTPVLLWSATTTPPDDWFMRFLGRPGGDLASLRARADLSLPRGNVYVMGTGWVCDAPISAVIGTPLDALIEYGPGGSGASIVALRTRSYSGFDAAFDPTTSVRDVGRAAAQMHVLAP